MTGILAQTNIRSLVDSDGFIARLLAHILVRVLVISLDKAVQTLCRYPQSLQHIWHQTAVTGDLPNRINPELFPIPLPTDDGPRYCYIVTLEGVY